LRFPGQYHDAEVELDYNYFRYYDPAAGRYLSGDMLGLSGGVDPHAHVPNPITWLDPLGLRACSIATKFAVPAQPGVYTIHLNSGQKYVGMATRSMAGRVNKAARSKHAVRKAGYRPEDVVNVSHIPMPGAPQRAIKAVEQTRIDWYGGKTGPTLVNRNNSFDLLADGSNAVRPFDV
jgi:RHS repeat-associated protein